MAETASTVPPKGYGTVKIQDFFKGLWIAVGSTVLALGYAFVQNHWKLLTFEQTEPYLNTIAAGFITYIGKNYYTNNVGQLFKQDKAVVHVDVNELDELKNKAAGNDAEG